MAAEQGRPETRRAAEALGLGLLVGLVHVAWLTGRFATPQGWGAVVDLVGCAAATAALWAVLAMRALADGGPVAHAVDDGLTAVAASVWMAALLPPGPENYLPENAANDFAYAYLPAALLAVPLLLLLRRVWPARTVAMLLRRLVTVTVACAAVMLALRHLTAG